MPERQDKDAIHLKVVAVERYVAARAKAYCKLS